MCWCNPAIRTPNCGAPECHPPVAADIPDWQMRVREEKAVLDEKLKKLELFIGTVAYAKLDEIDRSLLLSQRQFMFNYSDVLEQRINRFRTG